MYIFIPKNLIDDCQNLEKGAIATVIELNGTKSCEYWNLFSCEGSSANHFIVFIFIFLFLIAFSVLKA